MSLPVLTIYRYPVKSMGGEALDSVDIDARGLTGDRWYAVEDGDGRFASGKDSRRFRRRDAVFDHVAATDRAGVTVTGPHGTWRVGDPALDASLSAVMGAPVRVTAESDVPHQDSASVSLVGTATLRWCAERWGIDGDARRLRPNIVFESTEPFVEETWVGQTIRLGGATLRVIEPTERCRMIDVPQVGVPAEGAWLKPLAAEREMCAAVYADVVTPGRVAVGDTIEIGEAVSACQKSTRRC